MATQVTASGQLSNRGLIDGRWVQLNAASLDNAGTGRIYGDQLSIAAATVHNRDAEGRSASIAARHTLDIGAGQVINDNQALIYSEGSLAIGGDLDSERKATGSAQSVLNQAAFIESAGNMALSTVNLLNLNLGFSTREEHSEDTVNETYVYMQHNFDGERYLESDTGRCYKCMHDAWDPGWLSLNRYEYVAPSERYPFEAGFQRQPYLMPGDTVEPWWPPSGDTTEVPPIPPSKQYLEDDPVWRLFEVPYGDNLLLAQKLKAYNNDFMARASRYFTVAVVTGRETTQTVVDNPGVAGRITSGADMDLRIGAGYNINSQIIAGGAMRVEGGSLENTQTQGVKKVLDKGVWRMDNIEYSPYRHRWGQAGNGDYAVTVVDQTTTLGTGAIKQYAAAPVQGTVGVQSDFETAGQAATTSHMSGSVQTASVAHSSVVVADQSGATGHDTTAATQTTIDTAVQAGLGGSTAGSVTSSTAHSTAAHAVLRTSAPQTGLPQASLFGLTPQAGIGYLVETDPRFTNYRQWLSSDYMLQALGLDPSRIQKRLGDGFYEQKLIREQVAQLTGRRYLGNYTSDDAQYAALMNAGVTFALQHGLRPGIALTAEQVAQLTSDIVWLVEETVTLPDGATHTVLSPQVYARVQKNDLDGTGALLSGQSLDIALSQDFRNSGGTVAGRDIVRISSDNLGNLAGRITGHQVAIQAQQDILNIGGQIDADTTLLVQAGRDLRNETTTRTSLNEVGLSSFGRTGLDRVAGLYVTGATQGVLVASAGRDMHLVSSIVANASEQGRTQLQAGRDIQLSTVTVRDSANLIAHRQKNYASTAQSQEVASRVTAQGDISMQAGRDINARAAQVDAQGQLLLAAQRDVNLLAGEATRHLDEVHTSQGGGFLSRYKNVEANQIDSTRAQATQLGGQTIAISAGQDIQVVGSQVVSDQGTYLEAGRDIHITAATETTVENHHRESRKSGVFSGGGLGLSIGKQQQSSQQAGTGTSAAASTVGSVHGNVDMVAGGQYRQTGSDVLAPEGSVSVQAQDIHITEARETRQSTTEQRFKQSGLSVSIGSPLISAVQTAQSMAKAAGNTSSTRMQALAAGATALNLYNSADEISGASKALASGDPGKAASVSISLGSSKSQSRSTQAADSARASTIMAATDVSLDARGAGQASAIVVQGSEISAGANALLAAEGDIRLLAAQNTANQGGSSRSSAASIGVSLGAQPGISFSANQSRGNQAGDDLIHTNTHVSAGQAVQLQSGADTVLQGAVVRGDSVTALVGGQLALQSLQDSSTYNSRKQSAGASLTVSPAGVPIGGGFQAGASKIDSDYLSVTEQTGIKAGDGGFEVRVQGDTRLVGAVIASNQAAVEQGKNHFSTAGVLSTSDLDNHAHYQGKAVGVNASLGEQAGQFGVKGVGGGIGQDGGRASSTTTAGISGLVGDTAVRSTDAETGIQRIFEQHKLQKEIDAQVAITAEFGKQASKAVGDYAGLRLKEAEDARDQASIDAWKEGGAARAALHAVVGGLSGGVQGLAGAGVASAFAPAIDQLQGRLQEAFEEAGLSSHTAGAIAGAVGGATASVIGAAAGGGSLSGAAAAFNADTNNRQLSFAERTKADQLARSSLGKYTKEQIEDAMRNSANKLEGESIVSGMLVDGSKDYAIYDDGAVFRVGGAGPYSLVQVLPNEGKVNYELAKYIKKNTGGADSPYEWDEVQLGIYKIPSASKNSHLGIVVPARNGCITAECAAGLQGIGRPIHDVENIRENVADGAAMVSRVSGIVESTAQAAAVVPGPHQVLAVKVVFSASVIGLGASMAEDVVRPDVGKLLVDKLIDVSVDRFSNRAPLIAPVINEAGEVFKNSDFVKDIVSKENED